MPYRKRLPINGLEWCFQYKDLVLQRQYQELNLEEVSINMEDATNSMNIEEKIAAAIAEPDSK